ncbi:MAG: ribosome biogenesis GTP-binding protein YihA/YsxC [candidate division Zixibacteria bacterium]|nr:ribosome biogenesis GTP-binding protein YihA/YsxC [candidate division Zixibacteria bacterium]MCI0597309.1 ribosome biogenesis GTP-binding protein YihA/YsxC [candidate division Zixibacteria bacterium]
MWEIKKARFLKTVAALEACPNTFPEIAFAGRSNVGKSSLINALTNQKRLAETSKTPGKTRNLNYYLVNDNLFFVDLPGYGYAKLSAGEKARIGKLVDGYLNASPKLAGIISLLDFRHEPGEFDRQMADWVKTTGKPVLFVLTKADKLSRSQKMAQREKIIAALPASDEFEFVNFSAVTREGKPEILKWIFKTAFPKTVAAEMSGN